MMDKRFVKIYSQGFVGTMEIWVDTLTGSIICGSRPATAAA